MKWWRKRDAVNTMLRLKSPNTEATPQPTHTEGFPQTGSHSAQVTFPTAGTGLIPELQEHRAQHGALCFYYKL